MQSFDVTRHSLIDTQSTCETHLYIRTTIAPMQSDQDLVNDIVRHPVSRKKDPGLVLGKCAG